MNPKGNVNPLKQKRCNSFFWLEINPIHNWCSSWDEQSQAMGIIAINYGAQYSHCLRCIARIMSKDIADCLKKPHSHNTVAQVQIYKDEQLVFTYAILVLWLLDECFRVFVLKPLYLFINGMRSKGGIWLVLQYCSSLSFRENRVMVSCLLVFYRHAESCILAILDDGQGETGTGTWAWACDKMNTFIYLLVNRRTRTPWRDLHSSPGWNQ